MFMNNLYIYVNTHRHLWLSLAVPCQNIVWGRWEVGQGNKALGYVSHHGAEDESQLKEE